MSSYTGSNYFQSDTHDHGARVLLTLRSLGLGQIRRKKNECLKYSKDRVLTLTTRKVNHSTRMGLMF